MGVGVSPADQTVGNVGGIAVGGNAAAEVAIRGNGTRVVDARSLVVLGHIVTANLGKTLLETDIAVETGTVLNHALDHVVWARNNTLAVGVARVDSLEGLHESRVVEAVVGSRGADAALGLLHDDGENELGLDTAGASDLLDCLLDVVGLLLAVVVHAKLGAGLESGSNVSAPEVLERLPFRLLRPALGRGAVTAEDLESSTCHQGTSLLGAGTDEGSAEGESEKLASSDDVGSSEHVDELVGWLLDGLKCCKCVGMNEWLEKSVSKLVVRKNDWRQASVEGRTVKLLVKCAVMID